MNILSVEGERTDLIKKISTAVSPRSKLLYLYRFYDKLLNSQSSSFIESYLPEQIENYITFLQQFDAAGLHPQLVENILLQIEKLLKQDCLNRFSIRLNSAAEKLGLKYNKVKNTLNGIGTGTTNEGKLYFPVLEQGELPGKETRGLMESLTVQIKEGKGETKFLITPAGREIEKAIGEQIQTSWNYAISYLKKFVRRINPAQNVFIHFDHRYGEYVGNSLGTVLTLTFLKELLQFYNSPIVMNYKGKIAVTGGLDKDGKIYCVSKTLIRQKTETVFFSDADVFVINDGEKHFALEKLSELKRTYSKRDLKIVGVEDFDDLINRRNLVDITKRKFVVRSAKFAAKNWAAFFLLAAVIFLVYVGNFYDFDTNPAILVNKEFWLSVRNKNGKELWKKRMEFNTKNLEGSSLPSITEKLVDIDNDGTNEIILTREDPAQFNPQKKPGRITCYSSTGKQIWEYYFNDTVTSIEMVHSENYASFIIDTLTLNKIKTLVCFSNNTLYPSAVYFLDLKTGKRIGTTMWHTGHLHSGKIGEFNDNGKRELVMFGLNNAYKRAIVFSVDVDKISGQLPTFGVRKFLGLKEAQVNAYLLLPNTDYTLYLTSGTNKTHGGALYITDNGQRFINYLYEGEKPNYKGILIKLDGNLNVTKIDPSLEFESARDSLVVQGKLNPPLTHTKEYQKILYDQIRYWEGNKFITKENYEKRKAAR